MNGINLDIATGWTAATLAAQRKSWLEIMRLSREIKAHADSENWELLFGLAEQRDGLIAAFFCQSICKPIFHTIVHELADIKAEHSETMEKLKVRLERNAAREALLSEQKAEVEQAAAILR